MKTKLILSLAAIAGVCAAALSVNALGGQEPKDEFDVDNVIKACDDKVHRSLLQLKDSAGRCDYSLMPRNIAPGDTVWQLREATPEEWCAGFWPGVLWYSFENSRDRNEEREAENYTNSLKYLTERPIYDHDLGFLMLCSYGNGYRLTKNPEYRRVLLNAADSLATLFNPKVGTLCSWPRNVEMFGGHNTIMDNMINLELLFWAAKNGGSRHLYDIAVSHADTTMQYHFRPDGSCYHVAVYDEATGVFLRGCNHQGYNDNSSWARGQAWAIYGYTMVYRETNNRKYLDFVCKVADNYLSRLPDDEIPFWDFDDPELPNCSKDASAACVVASALLELQNYVDSSRSMSYHQHALRMLKSLSSEKYWSETSPAFLLHSTGHRPAGSEIDYSIIYADYYYIEALTRLKKLHA